MDWFRKNNSAPEREPGQNQAPRAIRWARRAFVQRRGLLKVFFLSTASFIAACDGDVPFAANQQGTIRVLVSGHSPGSANAGEARYTSGSVDLIVPIPVSGMLEQAAPVGTYQVTYTPPAGYSLAAGQQAQRTITITAGALTEVTFSLVANQAPTGVVRVTVSGLTGASSGGTAAILRTDLTGQTPVNVTVPVSGSSDTQVATGTYSVTYTPPTGFQLATGQTNPRTVTVAQSATATATFQVQASGGGGGGGGGGSGTVVPLFWSDWRTRIGNVDTELSDGGKWNSMSAGAGQNGSIIDAPAGFSTHKVLRVLSTTGHRDGWMEPKVTNLGEQPIGTTRNYRWEHAFHEPALADAGQHPIQDGGAVSISNWYLGTTNGGYNLANGQWGIDYVFGGNPSWPHTKFTLGAREGQYSPLQKGVVYRHEIQLVRISATQFRFHIWIHDAAGNLVFDDDDFHNRDGTTTLRGYVHTFSVVSNTGVFLVGLNGIGNTPTWPIHSSDQAAFAVVQGLAENTQIGAYGSVQGEVRR